MSTQPPQSSRQHERGEVWKHRTRARTVRVVSHNLRSDDVTVETTTTPARRSTIYGYNLRAQYARVDESGVVGPTVGREPAAHRLIRALDYRLHPGVTKIAPAQVAIVLHATADHTALMAALDYEADPGSPWPQATSVGRWLHDVADQADAYGDEVPQSPTADETAMALDLLSMVQAAGIPDTYFVTDARVRRACRVLDVDPATAAAQDWAGITLDDWNDREKPQ